MMPPEGCPADETPRTKEASGPVLHWSRRADPVRSVSLRFVECDGVSNRDDVSVLSSEQKLSVYVDDMLAPFGRMKMCHMYADTHDELMAMADAIGVNRKWLQYPGHPVKEHFDIAMSKRRMAFQAGAIPTTWRDYGLWAGRKRAEDPVSGHGVGPR